MSVFELLRSYDCLKFIRKSEDIEIMCMKERIN